MSAWRQGLERAVDQLLDQLLDLRARELDVEVLGPEASAVMNGRLISVSWPSREGDLGLLGRRLQALDRHRVLGQVDALVLLELGEQPVDDHLVDVVATEVGVAVGRLDLDHAFADLEDRDVEGAAAEVVDRDLLVGLLVQAVGQGRRGGLVDQAPDLEAGDPAGVLGRLALRVVEVGRHRDDRLLDLAAEVVLGRLLELAQHHGRDLGRRVLLVLDADPDAAVLGLVDRKGHHLHLFGDLVVAPSHEALDRVHGVLRVGHGLALGHLAHQALTALGEADHGGRRARALGVGDDLAFVTFHDRDDAVGRAQVDADDLAHVLVLLWLESPMFRGSHREGPESGVRASGAGWVLSVLWEVPGSKWPVD